MSRLAELRMGGRSKTTVAFGDLGGSAAAGWTEGAEGHGFLPNPPLHRLEPNPLGNLLGFGYHSPTRASVSAAPITGSRMRTAIRVWTHACRSSLKTRGDSGGAVARLLGGPRPSVERPGVISERPPEEVAKCPIEPMVHIKVSNKVKALHPVAAVIARNLAEVGPIRFVRILPDFLEASSETTTGRTKIPITTPGHPTAIGVSVIMSFAYKEIQFFAITSAEKGYGGRMVDAVMRSLPAHWRGVVAMDWSDGFWEHMSRKYVHLVIV